MVKGKEKKKKDVSEEGSQFQSGKKITRMVPFPELFPYQKWQKSERKLRPRQQLTEVQHDIKCVRGEEGESCKGNVFSFCSSGHGLSSRDWAFQFALKL